MEHIDDSIVNLSSVTLDTIDLTEDSPIRPSRSRQRNAEAVSSSHSRTGNYRIHTYVYRRALSPVTLGSIQDRRSPRKERRETSIRNSNEILILDEENDTINEEIKTYTVESDNRQPIPLRCPICLELLSSKLKPITTRCGHLFCTECLETFFRTSKKCPTCKTTITLKSCTRLYL